MNTYITHSGIGTEVERINPKGLCNLIKKTEALQIQITKDLEKHGKNLDSEDITLEDFESFDCPITIASECLNEIAKCESFIEISDDGGYRYILFVDQAPWEYTERERNFSKKDVENCLNLLKDVVPDMEIENLYIANYIAD